MKAKHTPGPWLVHYLSTVHMDDVTVADCGARRVVVHGGSITKQDEIANAALIAAAPDMLAALRAIVDSGDCDPDDDNGDKCARCKALDAARALIARVAP